MSHVFERSPIAATPKPSAIRPTRPARAEAAAVPAAGAYRAVSRTGDAMQKYSMEHESTNGVRARRPPRLTARSSIFSRKARKRGMASSR